MPAVLLEKGENDVCGELLSTDTPYLLRVTFLFSIIPAISYTMGNMCTQTM